MKRIKMSANILFSGVGFQERGIRNTGLYELEVKNTSEIKKEAILAYAGIHCGLTPEMIKAYREYPTLDSMIEELKEKNIGFIPPADNENAGIPFDWEKYRKKPEYIKKYWLAVKLSHCQGDISRIKELSYADLWTVSFPCQSISVAGKMKGFNPDSGTRSSLLWENIRLLKNACDKGEAPKYILFENVKNLAKKFLKDFEALMDVLDDLGFNSYWDILNEKIVVFHITGKEYLLSASERIWMMACIIFQSHLIVDYDYKMFFVRMWMKNIIFVMRKHNHL